MGIESLNPSNRMYQGYYYYSHFTAEVRLNHMPGVHNQKTAGCDLHQSILFQSLVSAQMSILWISAARNAWGLQFYKSFKSTGHDNLHF